jgi:hypothetical protein
VRLAHARRRVGLGRDGQGLGRPAAHPGQVFVKTRHAFHDPGRLGQQRAAEIRRRGAMLVTREKRPAQSRLQRGKAAAERGLTMPGTRAARTKLPCS